MNLTSEQKLKGVITTSAGNHSQAMAHQGGRLGVPITVVMPTQAPLVKVNSCRKLKANVILHGAHFEEARAHAMKLSHEKKLVYINGYDHPDIIAGQGTMAHEIMESEPEMDYIVVPIGGGGMIAGVVAAVRGKYPKVKIIGVESERCPSWSTAMEAGSPVPCEKSKNGAKNSIADGLSVIQVGINAFATANGQLERVIRLSEDYISLAVLKLLESEKAVVEGAGATGFAAILSGLLPELQGKNVACILCGGNIDPPVLGRVINRGLVMDGRLSRFTCVVSDRSGGLNGLLHIIATHKASIKEIHHDRMTLPALVYKTKVICEVETTDKHHLKSLRALLKAAYNGDVKWIEFEF